MRLRLCAYTEMQIPETISPHRADTDTPGFAMTAIEVQLLERLKKLPPSRVAEVVDFVEFLASREERAAAARRLTEALARLDALKLPLVTDDEVEAEVDAVRQDRRSGRLSQGA